VPLPGKTIIFVDPLGKAKANLVDNEFREATGIIVPTMETLKLSEDIAGELQLEKPMALGPLGRLMKKVTKPPRLRLIRFIRRSKTGPFICIVDIPKDATENDVVVLLRSAAQLQRAADKTIITDVCLREFYDDAKRRFDLGGFEIFPS